MKKILITVTSFVFFIFSIVFSNLGYAQINFLNENQMWQKNLIPSNWVSYALGDINNDSKLDLILIGCTSMSGTECNGYVGKVYINNGTSFNENSTWEQNLTALNYGSLALGDIDNDGNLDLIVTGCNNGGGLVATCKSDGYQRFIYINNRTTFLENQTWEDNITKSWKGSLALGDINNDGKLDLIVTGTGADGYLAKIYINNGTKFVESLIWSQNLTPVYEGGVSFGDINNDGNLDLIVNGDKGISEEITKVYINNGTNLLENVSWEQNLLGVDWASLSLGDINNDGKLDLTLIGHTTQDNHRIYNNTGTTFIEIQKESPSGGTLGVGMFDGSLAFGDYDNNGYLDLAATGNEGYSYIFVNNNGTFTNSNENLIALEKGSHIVWGDVNNDYKLDVILIGWHEIQGYQAKIYINNVTSPNNFPSPPVSDFDSTYNFSTGKLILSWGNGSDTETPALGLYYNLRVGTCSGCHDVVSGVFGGGDDNGYFGNMMQRKRIVLNRPDLKNKTIYWAVQTIDTGLAKSAWSQEQVFNITQAPPPCMENWTYGEWDSCINNQQSRVATDLNNCSTTINRSAIVQSCSTNPSGSSGPSGSPATTTLNEKPKIPENATWYFEIIRAGVDTGFNINKTDLPIRGIWVKVKNEIKEAAINIKKLVSKPLFIEKEPEGRVYNYLNITCYNFNDSNIESGKIKFRVEKSWLNNNSINKSAVVLNRYSDNDWRGMATFFESENTDYAEYQADTPGFSIFSISGQTLEEIKAICVSNELRCESNKIEECSEDGINWTLKEVCDYGCENNKCKVKTVGNVADFPYYFYAIIITLIIIIGIVVGVFSRKRSITPRIPFS